MSTLVLDEQLRRRLDGLRQPFEVKDELGHTVGQFLPQSLYRQLLVDWAKRQISEEELDRRAAKPGGRSLAEIMRRLGADA